MVKGAKYKAKHNMKQLASYLLEVLQIDTDVCIMHTILMEVLLMI